MERIYYSDHAQRYAHMSEDERTEYPDEIKTGIIWLPVIKRVKTLVELRAEPKNKRYSPDIILLAAKDIPVSRAMLYH